MYPLARVCADAVEPAHRLLDHLVCLAVTPLLYWTFIYLTLAIFPSRRRHLGYEVDALGAIALASGAIAGGLIHRWVLG